MVEVPDTYLKGRKPEDFCAMHVRGDSMYPDFRNGDIVLVLKQNTREPQRRDWSHQLWR